MQNLFGRRVPLADVNCMGMNACPHSDRHIKQTTSACVHKYTRIYAHASTIARKQICSVHHHYTDKQQPVQQTAGFATSGETEGAGDSSRQAATGGIVEFRDGDFDKMLTQGDKWVVMFYAPWCAHCKSAEPDFQQAGLQAPVHFARLDAIKFSEVAEREQVTGFPTFK